MQNDLEQNALFLFVPQVKIASMESFATVTPKPWWLMTELMTSVVNFSIIRLVAQRQCILYLKASALVNTYALLVSRTELAFYNFSWATFPHIMHS